MGTRASALKAAKDSLDRNGLCIIPNVLTEIQAAQARRDAVSHLSHCGKRYHGGTVQHDVLNHAESLHWLLSDTPLSEIVHAFIGDRPQYVHHADLLHNTFTGWHKDSTGVDAQGNAIDFWQERDGKPYKIYKFALYLQDHSRDNTALKYVPGSHLDSEFYSLQKRLGHFVSHEYVQCTAKDLVVFDQRLTHNGVSPWLPSKIVHRLLKSERAKQRLWASERALRGIQDRVFIQIAFGEQSDFVQAHADAMAKRQARVNQQSHYAIHPELSAMLFALGLPACDLTVDAEKGPDAGDQLAA